MVQDPSIFIKFSTMTYIQKLYLITINCFLQNIKNSNYMRDITIKQIPLQIMRDKPFMVHSLKNLLIFNDISHLRYFILETLNFQYIFVK